MPDYDERSVFHDDVPAMFADATSDEPLLADWVAQVAHGEPAELLILGPGWSGKTHIAWVAYNALLAAGVQSPNIAAVNAHAYGEANNAAHDVLNRPVVIFDPADYGDPEYHFDSVGLPNYQPKERTYDEPEVQAVLAIQAANVNDIAIRLAFSTNHARLFTATSATSLERALGEGVARNVLAWPTISLSRRPTDDVLTWG